MPHVGLRLSLFHVGINAEAGMHTTGAGLKGYASTSILFEADTRDKRAWLTMVLTISAIVGLWILAVPGLAATCFGEGTPIQMADGTTKPIELIEKGDIVLSYNMVTGLTEPDEVTELYQTRNRNLTTFTFGYLSPLGATIDHPFYVVDTGWCSINPDMTRKVITNMADVQQLEVGDTCLIYNMGQIEEVRLSAVERIGTMNRTYTIQRLKHNETFFAGGVLVGTEVVKTLNALGTIQKLKASIYEGSQ